ncbi:hypothetical protein [Agathobacter sp.]|uniref:hypothetical protein n=1 Tax=Agathobacter sp. TaxID=2021311 RepID=UPI003FD73312
MACFLVPATEAVATTIVTKVMENREKKQLESLNLSEEEKKEYMSQKSHTTLHKMRWLNNMLWGGSALLAFEHVWHGEVVPFFPFLTAASNPQDAMQMLHEMGTVGVTMAIVVTVVWGIMVGITNAIDKLPENDMAKKEV